jgi:hypothetical protein
MSANVIAADYAMILLDDVVEVTAIPNHDGLPSGVLIA